MFRCLALGGELKTRVASSVPVQCRGQQSFHSRNQAWQQHFGEAGNSLTAGWCTTCPCLSAKLSLGRFVCPWGICNPAAPSRLYSCFPPDTSLGLAVLQLHPLAPQNPGLLPPGCCLCARSLPGLMSCFWISAPGRHKWAPQQGRICTSAEVLCSS